MSYNAKTDWKLNDIVLPDDLNKIEAGIADIEKDVKLKNLTTTGNAIKELSNGKYKFEDGRTVFTDYPSALTTRGCIKGVVVVDSDESSTYKTFQITATTKDGYSTRAMFGANITSGTITWFDPVDAQEVRARIMTPSGKIKDLKYGKYQFTNGSLYTDYPKVLTDGGYLQGMVIVDSSDTTVDKTYQIISTNGTSSKAMFGWCNASLEIQWFEPIGDKTFNGTKLIEDANLAVDYGNYYVNATCLNIPVQKYGVLQTTVGGINGDWVYQTFITTQGEIYKRQNINSGGWSAWDSLVVANTTEFKSGETILAFVASAKNYQRKFISSSYYPSDAPVKIDAWIDVMVDATTGRKLCIFTPYSATPNPHVYYRSWLNSEWLSDWGSTTANLETHIGNINNYVLNLEGIVNKHKIYTESADTRENNEPPSYYMTNFPSGRVLEFKNTSKIGLTASTYILAQLETIVPYLDSTGGLPIQIATNQVGQWIRYATSATAWGAWDKYTMDSHAHAGKSISPSSIELSPPSGSTGGGGFIDFHYNGSNADYTSRIIEGALGQLNIDAPNGIIVSGVDPSKAVLRTVSAGTTDLVANSTALGTGIIHIVYE